MGTPKKTPKSPASKISGERKQSGLADDATPKKRMIDDDDFEEPLDDLDGYMSYNDDDDDDDDYKY
ncbi:hypothetical protein DJ568_15250 [Mucilaginibacter hurinus]|uniref:Uncharacterized protein n=2 Tax=Mucilaginibacter hurinus TaxID=2201324 RepID=A0A367GK89_9SPHI|nr:hypothetical protein DJ568_15250 [Mucilaginibacter hurinus]